MTPEEQNVADALSEVWRLYVKLPELLDSGEDAHFRQLIHEAQRTLLLRPALHKLGVIIP